MGSKQSQNNNNKEEKDPEKLYNINKKYNAEVDDSSLTYQTKENTENTSITTTTDFFDYKNKKVLYKFEWKGKGKIIQITGDFLEDWKLKENMHKNEESGFYEVILPLDSKKHTFKFIVDGIWACSNQYPTNYDYENNLNNFIDLTNYTTPFELIKEYNEIKKKELNIQKIKFVINNKEDEEMKNQLSPKNGGMKKKTYNCEFPSNNDLNTYAPAIMWHYKPIFNLDYQSNQTKISKIIYKNEQKNKKNKDAFLPCLSYKEKNFNNENNTYKKIMTWPHEKLMHFCTNLEDIENDYKQFFRICTTNRNKHKFLTIIYYKPK